LKRSSFAWNNEYTTTNTPIIIKNNVLFNMGVKDIIADIAIIASKIVPDIFSF
jgi:hypothetical protein